jgi:MinD superfamily P-loop ATPase
MKQLAVISGKGGTGKTSLTGAFAVLAREAIMADCDVDAANLHLLICDRESRTKSEPFISGAKAVVNPKLCNGCGWCESVCRFEAIHMNGTLGTHGNAAACVNPMLCEGCGTCRDGCPSAAVELRDYQAGELLVTQSRLGTLVHAELKPGEGSSGKLVTKVRTRAEAIAKHWGADQILIDGSPGIGCPVIASITGVDGVIIVTEPTVSGKSDLQRALELCRYFGIPAFVLINKCDLNGEMAMTIEEKCRNEGVPVVGKLRYDHVFVDAMIAGMSVMEVKTSTVPDQIRQIWFRLQDLIKMSKEKVAG